MKEKNTKRQEDMKIDGPKERKTKGRKEKNRKERRKGGRKVRQEEKKKKNGRKGDSYECGYTIHGTVYITMCFD